MTSDQDYDGIKDHPINAGELNQYYQRFFPFKYLFQWLNHSLTPTNDFCHREIAFTLEQGQYVRYLSFPNYEQFQKDVLRMMPFRFEIGPVYSSDPRTRKLQEYRTSFKPQSKELVFDIDLTDYDPIRTCCQDKKICTRCWNYITVAIHIIDEALREDFGFEHILWVYSGRRGIHAWICDQSARTLSDTKRRALASYLQVIGKTENGRLSIRHPYHPHIQRSFDYLKDSFRSFILQDQNPWAGSNEAESLLALLPFPALQNALRSRWNSMGDVISSETRWKHIDEEAANITAKDFRPEALRQAKQDIILEYMYPRLDIEVSKHLNHLLKSPFCVHPSTGRVCVPIDPQDFDSFDPMEVPTVNSLLEELNMASPGSEGLPDVDRTELKLYVDYFHDFVAKLLKSETHENLKRKRQSTTSVNDW